MKYVVVLCDGMADYKLPQLNDKTPMTVADKPVMNELAKNGKVGLVKTVADGLKPGSDVANLSVMGYDPMIYYAGRSPLEAASIGIELKPTDVALRCNLVTVSDEENYEDKTLIDYCAGDIHTHEADILVKYLQEKLGDDEFALFTGVSYRHCLVWNNGTDELGGLTPPHDITGRKVADYVPKHPDAQKLYELMKKSHELLKDHPVNKARIEKGLNRANSAWFWGEGRAKPLTPFKEKFGVDGAVISAVDLIKGIGKLAKMDVIEVEGATGYLDTNFEGKCQATIDALKTHDFVYLHMEAPDECGHRNELENKIKSLEIIDKTVLSPLVDALNVYDDYKILICPDHATPIALKTHVSDPVPFLIYHKKGSDASNVEVFDEETASSTGVYIEHGPSLIEDFLK